MLSQFAVAAKTLTGVKVTVSGNRVAIVGNDVLVSIWQSGDQTISVRRTTSTPRLDHRSDEVDFDVTSECVYKGKISQSQLLDLVQRLIK